MALWLSKKFPGCIVAKMNRALDEVRAGESRRMASEGRTSLLKKSRWLLLKREENLKEEQRFRLATWAGKFLDWPSITHLASCLTGINPRFLLTSQS